MQTRWRQAQSKYTFFLNEQAGILDDLIVTRLGEDRFMVVANAGNAAADEAHLRDVAKGFDCRIDALDRVFLAIQGPRSGGCAARGRRRYRNGLPSCMASSRSLAGS